MKTKENTVQKRTEWLRGCVLHLCGGAFWFIFWAFAMDDAPQALLSSRWPAAGRGFLVTYTKRRGYVDAVRPREEKRGMKLSSRHNHVNDVTLRRRQ